VVAEGEGGNGFGKNNHPGQLRSVPSADSHRKSKKTGREDLIRSRPVPFQQRTDTSWRSIGSQPAVSRRLFRCFEAHLLRSPWTVKLGSDTSARFAMTRGQSPPAESLGSPTPLSVLCQMTSSRCRNVLRHSSMPFVVVGSVSRLHWQTKNPASVSGKQGWKIRVLISCYLLTLGLTRWATRECFSPEKRPWTGIIPPHGQSRRVPLCGTCVSGQIEANMLMRLFIERVRRITRRPGYGQLIL
jgi:hypothetical protein